MAPRIPVPLEPVTSSNLAALGFDEDARTLYVQFTSGHVYRYTGCAPNIWAGLQAAPSKGGYYAHEVKGQLRGEPLTGTCANCGDIGDLDDRCTDCGTAYYQRKDTRAVA